jgi:hypothetical protein
LKAIERTSPGSTSHPHRHGDRRQEQFDQHPGGADHRPPPFVAKSTRSGRVDVGNRRQDEQHDAHLVHLAVARLDGVGVTQFVQRLDQRIDQPEQKEVMRREHLIAEVGGQLMPVHAGKNDRRQHQQQPQQNAEETENRPHQRPAAVQESVRIPQRNADRHRVDEALQQLLTLLLAAALGQLIDIRRQVGLQQVAGVQLRQQADHFVLRWRVFAGFCGHFGPHLVDRSLPVHQLDHAVGRGD